MKAKLIKTESGYYIDTGKLDGIHLACYPHSIDKQKLSLKNCQAIERGYDLDELAYEHIGCSEESYMLSDHWKHNSFKAGFQKALEILGDKKFTEEDVISMIEKSRETGLTAQFLILTKQQTEWDVEIVTEPYVKYVSKFLGTVYPPLGVREKLDSDGCLILKLKSE